MKNEHQLRESYPEALGEGADEKLLRLVSSLDSVYTAYNPPEHATVATSQALRRRAAVRGRARAQESRAGILNWSARRVATLAASLVIAVLLGITGYAAIPLLERVFDLEGGTGQIVSEDLGQKVNLTQRLGKYTVTVERVYADANRAVIAYTIYGPAGYNPDRLADVKLVSAQGDVLRPIGGQSWGVVDQEQAIVESFDAAGLDTAVEQLNLRLQAQGVRSWDGEGNVGTVRGELNFDLVIPVHRSQVLNPQQVVEADGVAVTLERVVVSPTETRVYLRGLEGQIEAELMVPGQQAAVVHNSCTAFDDGLTTCSYREGLGKAAGDWNLLVKKPEGLFVIEGGEARMLADGPWEFHFSVLPE